MSVVTFRTNSHGDNLHWTIQQQKTTQELTYIRLVTVRGNCNTKDNNEYNSTITMMIMPVVVRLIILLVITRGTTNGLKRLEIHTCMETRKHTHTRKYTHAYKHKRKRKHTYTHKHTQIYTFIHIHNKPVNCQVPQTNLGIQIPLSTWQDTEGEEEENKEYHDKELEERGEKIKR